MAVGTNGAGRVSRSERITQVVVFLLAVVFIPIMLPVMFIFRIYRNVLKALIRNELGDDTVFVSGDDSVWLQDSKENRAIINSLFTLSGQMDLEKYRERINDNMVHAKHPKNRTKRLFPKVSAYPAKVLRRYIWMPDPNFDINEHLYVHPEPCPGNKTDLQNLVSKLCSAPLPTNKAAWQLIILNPGQDDPNYGKLHYVVFRVHHSIADGISLVRMFLDRLVDKIPQPENKARFGSRNFFMKLLQAAFEGPALLLSRFVQPEDVNALHGPTLSGIKRYSWSEPMDLDLIKRIKNATQTTVNDVVMACLASAFRAHFRQHSCTIPDNVLNYVPVDIRSSSANVTLDNQFGVVMLQLPVDQADPLATLRETRERMNRVKASPEPIVNALVLKYAMNRLPNWLTESFFAWVAAKATLVLSNLPGPQEQMRFAGHPLEAIIFWPPQKRNVGMGVSIFSYCGTVRIGVTTDKNIMTRPETFVNLFVSEVNSLAAKLNVEN